VPYEADSAARSFGEAEMLERFPDIDTLIYESGGDNLTLTFSPALADVFVFVLDTAEGEKMPRKRGPGITESDILVINKIDIAQYVRPDGALVAVDRVRLQPGQRGIAGNAVMADHDVLAMFYIFTPAGSPAPGRVADAVHAALAPFADRGVLSGVSELPSDAGTWVRLMGDDTVAVSHAGTALTSAVHHLLTGARAAVIRKS